MKFREPPGVQLLTADGFSRVEVVCPPDLLPSSDDHNAYLKQFNVQVGLSDVKDCFHRLRQQSSGWQNISAWIVFQPHG